MTTVRNITSIAKSVAKAAAEIADKKNAVDAAKIAAKTGGIIALNTVSNRTIREGLKYAARKAINHAVKRKTKNAMMKCAFKTINKCVTYGVPGLNIAMMAWDAYDIARLFI